MPATIDCATLTTGGIGTSGGNVVVVAMALGDGGHGPERRTGLGGAPRRPGTWIRDGAGGIERHVARAVPPDGVIRRQWIVVIPTARDEEARAVPGVRCARHAHAARAVIRGALDF